MGQNETFIAYFKIDAHLKNKFWNFWR